MTLPTKSPSRPRPEPLARQHHPRDARRRHARSATSTSYSVTGLTSNPSIFDKAIARRDTTTQIHGAAGREVAPRTLLRARDRGPARVPRTCSAPIYERTGRRRWLGLARGLPAARLRHAATTAEARDLHGRADRENIFIKIPGTQEGLPAIEASIFAGIPINVTLLFSPDSTWRRPTPTCAGIERRIEAGLTRTSSSVASLFMSAAGTRRSLDTVPDAAPRKLGPRDRRSRPTSPTASCCDSDRWQRLRTQGARPQRLLWASTGTKDPALPTLSTSLALCAPSRSTRCPTPHSCRSPTTARSGAPMPTTAARPTQCWPAFGQPASTSMRSPPSSRARAPTPS